MNLSIGSISLRRWLSLVAILLTPQLVTPSAFADDDGPVVGLATWAPRLQANASDYDKTAFWACIAVSPSTGKFASSVNWEDQGNADRQAREKCNATDARAVVICRDGWCSLALGKDSDGVIGWGVGWGNDQDTAEKNALDGAKDEKLVDPKVVYSVMAREPRTGGAIAFSESTGKWAYSAGGGRSAPYKALQNCKAPDAKIIAQEFDCWMALALGDDKGVYGWGYAGNKADAEKNALDDCSKRTKNAKIVASFATNGVTH